MTTELLKMNQEKNILGCVNYRLYILTNKMISWKDNGVWSD
jgi:hypothetical protein